MKKETVDTGGERDLDKLLAEFGGEVAALRELCADAISSTDGNSELRDAHHGFDDIFLLRYVLSFGRPELAKPAVEAAVEFRRNNWAWLKPACTGGGLEQCPHVQDLKGSIGVAGLLDGVRSISEDELLFLVRSGSSDTKAVMKLKTVDEVADFLSYTNEVNFQTCERETRERNRLVKLVNVNDMSGAKLLNFDRRFGSALGQSSHRSEYLHPQLIHKPVMFNPPSVFKSIFSFLKLLLSKSMVEKMSVCLCPKGPQKGDITQCPFVSRNFRISDIPEFLGGAKVLPQDSVFNEG